MRQTLAWTSPAIFAVALAACGGQQPAATSQTAGSAGPPLATKNMPPVAGQEKTCAGPREKAFDLDVIETTGIELGLGTTFAAWGYNGRIPGPTIEACQGDRVTINVQFSLARRGERVALRNATTDT